MMNSINDVELFLLDLDGTVYIENRLIPGALETIDKLRSLNKKICFVTNNSSRTLKEYVIKLKELGIDVTEDEVCTSTQAMMSYVKMNHPDKKMFLLANKSVRNEVAEAGFNLSFSTPEMVVIAFDTSLEYNSLNKCCQHISKGMPYIATHPDYVCPAEYGVMPDVGSFIELIYAVTKRRPDIICGKPDKIMGQYIKDRFNLKEGQIAMIGDRLYTDISFAFNNNFCSVLVLSGETTMDMLASYEHEPDYIIPSLRYITDYIK